MVERVEVLTGGASAVYGSDAVAGVVNFIMKKDFEGVQLDAQYGFYQHNNDFGGPGAVKLRDVIAGRAATNPAQFELPDDNVTDGESIEVSVTMGVDAPKTAAATSRPTPAYRDNEEVLQARPRLLGLLAGPTSTRRPRRRSPAAVPPRRYPGPISTGGGDVRQTSPIDDQATGNTFRPFDPTLDQYNFGPLNYYQRPDTRYTLGAMGHYELAEYADVYTQLMFTRLRVDRPDRAGGEFVDTNTINCDNPLLSAAAAGDDRLHADARSRRGDDRCRCTSAGATSRAAAARTPSGTLVPRRGRRPWRDLGELGLRRHGAVLEGQGRRLHAEPLPSATRALDARDRRRRPTRPRRIRSAARCVDGYGSELRAVQHLRRSAA